MSYFISSTFSGRRRAVIATLASGMLALALSGCSDPKPTFKGTDIGGTHMGQHMAMVDSSGHLRTLADYKGKVVVIYFGYTHCPDVCPTTLAELAHVMRLLKSDAKKVQVIMITVDPKRDTPAIIDKYVKAFYPTFIGLSGTAEQLEKTAKSFKVYYAKIPGTTPNNYAMGHSSRIYIVDRKGRARVLLDGTAPPKAIAHDIKQLLPSGSWF